MRILFVWPNKDIFGIKPLNLSLLSAIAKKHGARTGLFDTTVFDFGFADYTAAGESAKMFKPVDMSVYGHKKEKRDLDKEFSEELAAFNPDILAVTSLSDEYPLAARIIRTAKKIMPGLPVILGGKFPTISPSSAISLPGVDYICVGEGLEAFDEFVGCFKEGKDPSGILNIWAKVKKGVKRNRVRPLKTDLDDLPYVDWDIFGEHQFYRPFDGRAVRGGDHTLNWGCPKHCSFCTNHFYHSLYDKYFLRRYGIERIITELKYLKKKYRLGFFTFQDEDFLMRPVQELRSICRMYKDEIGLPFTIMANPRSVTEEKAAMLKEMRCMNVSVGIETGNEKLRSGLLNRIDTRQDILKAFSLLNAAGVRTSSFNLLGIPYETRGSYEETVLLNRQAQVQYPYMGFFYPFEGTELRKTAVKKGFFKERQGRYVPYYRDRPALKFKEFSPRELMEMRNVFVLYVKLPECYAPYIRRSEKLTAEGRALRAELLRIYEETVWEAGGWFKDNGRQDEYMRRLKNIMLKRKKRARR